MHWKKATKLSTKLFTVVKYKEVSGWEKEGYIWQRSADEKEVKGKQVRDKGRYELFVLYDFALLEFLHEFLKSHLYK